MARRKTIAIFIAYNAAKTLERFYKNFPKGEVDEIILVDDCSKDDTFNLSLKLGIKTFRNPVNLGYGGNLKRTLAIALKQGGRIFIDIHPDGEYQTSAIPQALKEIDKGAQFVLGNRFTTFDKPLKSGMHLWKLIPIKALNWIDNFVLRANIKDFHQGFRVYTKEMLEKIAFEENSNNYLFSFELIAQAVFAKVKIAQVPVETSYTGKKRGASLKNSLQYSLGTFKVLFEYLLSKSGFHTRIFAKPRGSLLNRVKSI